MAKQIPITDEYAKERGAQLVDQANADVHDRRDHIEKIKQIRAYYFGKTGRELRYTGQVNMHLPVITEKVEALTLKTVNSFYGAEPFVNVSRPGGEVDPERTRDVEEYLSWKFAVDIPDSFRTIKHWVRGSYLDGPSVLFVHYCKETRKGVQVAIQKRDWQQGEADHVGMEVPATRPKEADEILLSQFGVATEIIEIKPGKNPEDPLDGVTALVSFVENREKYTNIEVHFQPGRFIDEVELCIYRPVIVHDGVKISNVMVEDLVVPYRCNDLQTGRVGRKYWLTIEEIRDRIENEGWSISEDELEQLKSQARSEKQEELSYTDGEPLKDQRDAIVGDNTSGLQRTYNFEPFVDNKVLIFEYYLLDDADKDGQNEEVILQIPAYLRKVVRADYLESLFPHGRRPFPVLHGVQIDDKFYSIPIAQWLLPINIEVNTTLNQVHEAQEIINNPFFFYEPTAFGPQAAIQDGLRPGQGVPVMSAKGIFMPAFPQQPLANLQAVDSLLLFADRLTMSPMSSGSSQVRNAPRTARGTLALLSEGSSIVDSYVMEAQQCGWRELVSQVHALEYHFGPEERWFWVTDSPKPKRMARTDLGGKFEYIFTGNSTNTNKEVRRTIATQLYQLLAADPQMMQDPNARLELIRHLVRNNSEGLNTDVVMPAVQGMLGSHPPMSQQAENELLLMGQDVDVLPVDDDVAHIAGIRQLLTGQQFELLQPFQVTLLATHLNKHARQLMQKQTQGAVQGPVTANNVAPPGGDLSGMEGGVA